MAANAEVEAALRVLEEGLPVQRTKRGKIQPPSAIYLTERQTLCYDGRQHGVTHCAGRAVKQVAVSELLEVRQGYSTDGFHKAMRRFKFQVAAPEQSCFSIIFKHRKWAGHCHRPRPIAFPLTQRRRPRFVCKSIDFVIRNDERAAPWLNALRTLLARSAKSPIAFNEKLFVGTQFRKADLDKNGEITFPELWKLLKQMNLQLSEIYVAVLFKDLTVSKEKKSLSEEEFFRLFEVLTDLPEYKNALRLASPGGDDFLDAEGLLRFLEKEQHFSGLDPKKAQAIIDFCETGDAAASNATAAAGEDEPKKVLTANGFRRLLQSRWGNMLKEGHESLMMDMERPLPSYFIKSSHNSYLTGVQVRGNATVEGFISALRKGVRLLELDIFDGDNGEPAITHKRTFISSISLRNALKCIGQYAFQTNPFPVILTLENHVSPVQQAVMADIFVETLGDKLYTPGDAKAAKEALPSPNALKHKILLRGKISEKSPRAAAAPAIAAAAAADTSGDQQSPQEGKTRPLEDASFWRLIALPSAKLSANIYADIEEHPMNGSPSISESKVASYLEAEAPLAAYTATHLAKSFPSGLRQDSSNMRPMPSLLCGIQCIAMNVQTADEDMDLVNGLFAVNGNVGYVLKPRVLLDGIDPRHESSERVAVKLRIAVICGNYLPKSEPGKDIIDPFVSLQVYGVPVDERKHRTRAIKNNGFCPVWNENFEFDIHCPELAMLRLVVRDYDSTTTHDFIGEFSLPVASIRPGYSHIRLNTGFEHSADDAASLFVRVAFD